MTTMQESKTKHDANTLWDKRLSDLESAPHVTGGWQRVRGDIAPDAPSVRLKTPLGEEPRPFYRIQVRLPPPEQP